MNKSTFEALLTRDGKWIYSNVGDSMWPFIRQGRDLLVIEPLKGRLKRLDVPLYRRDSGQYVLRRSLAVKPDGYVICGDNRFGSGVRHHRPARHRRADGHHPRREGDSCHGLALSAVRASVVRPVPSADVDPSGSA